MQTKLLINGELVSGDGEALSILDASASGEIARVVDPNPCGLASFVRTRDPGTVIKGSGTGLDMSVYALDACTSIRHVMIAH